LVFCNVGGGQVNDLIEQADEAWLTMAERLLLAWYSALALEERRALDEALAQCAGPPSASVVALLRRDLQQLLEIAAAPGRD
jgi:hypothetical protein